MVLIAISAGTAIRRLPGTIHVTQHMDTSINEKIPEERANSGAQARIATRRVAVGQMTACGNLEKNFETCKDLAKVSAVPSG